MIGALLLAASGLLKTLWRVARQLFHETAGALFIVLAVLGAASAWREWRRGSGEGFIGLGIGFALVMGAFAVASFRSAWRVK